MNEIIEVRIEKLVYGGDGLGRVDGQAVFVPLTAPGDIVRARVVERRKGFLRAAMVELVSPGPDRREAPCRYFGTCGGCQLQHMTYAAQLAAKAGFVGESLERLGRIAWPYDIPVYSSPAGEFGYRIRTTIHIAPDDDGAQAFGFFEHRSHAIVDIESCALLVPELDAAWHAVRDCVNEFDRTRQIELAADGNGAAADPPVAAIGTRDLLIHSHGLAYSVAPGVFFQVNRPMLETLVARTLDGVNAGSLALDLFSGAGLFSLPLAHRFDRVIAVEGHDVAMSYARANALANDVRGIEFVTGAVETFLETEAASLGPIDLALLDPPRAGLGVQAARHLATLAPKRINYVSCDPGTLARDLRVLIDSGYRLDSVEAIDLFPQTFHVETIARLQYTGA